MEKRRSTTRLAVLLTMCGVTMLVILLSMLILRYRAVESELDRMLAESLTAHTVEAGEGAGYLLNYAETVLKNVDLLIEEESRRPEQSWVEPMVKNFNLVDNRMELSYLGREALDTTAWGAEVPELLQRLLAGEAAVSGLISASGEPFVVAVRPVKWEGQVVGALQAKVDAGTLLQQGKHSTFFHSVNSVIAGEDGRIVFGGNAEQEGMELASLGTENDISDQDSQTFTAEFQENGTGFFHYDPAGGRCYVAWAQVGYNGWRVVQVSQSPTVQIERSAMVQTVVMLASLAVCGVLAAMLWRQRARLAEEKLRYDALAQFKDTLLFEYDCRDDSLEFTSNALETLALTDVRLERVSDERNEFPIFHPDDIASVRRTLANAESMTPEQIDHDRIRMKKRDGGYSWYRSQYKAVFYPDGTVSRVIGTLTDISAQIDRERELREQAQQDPLTGLYNRAGVKVINARLEQISRGILFMLDLDDFKSINDTYGHAAGDKVLVGIGQILKDTFRADDIVTRVGGDEFVAFLSGSDNETMAREKAQELLDRVGALRIEGVSAKVGVSIGISSAPTYGRTFEALSAAADEVLYEVKKGGKGGFILK